ncbi:hypothetical protein GRZ55_20655 [Chelativorans sp. ZYF759]|nr:hypothetical protein [Chelativorans sp. ZYF759]
MLDAIIASTVRTPIGKAYRGGHAIEYALRRSGRTGGEMEDLAMGCAMQEGATGLNVARRALLTPGPPVTVAGTTIDRQCSSVLQSMALLANASRNDGVVAGIAGGLESISLLQNGHRTALEEYGGILRLGRARLRLPEERDFVARYLASAIPTPRLTPFHVAFALFRFAVIFIGIADRARAGNAAAANAAEGRQLAARFAARAREVLARNEVRAPAASQDDRRSP